MPDWIERRLAVEGQQRIEPGSDERLGPRAGCPARNGLVEERLDETLGREIRPVDGRVRPGEVESDRRPAGQVGDLHQSLR